MVFQKLTLCLAYVAEIRCYLEIGEPITALQQFESFLETIRPRFQRYVEILLTCNPSAYLDPQLKEEIDLKRLTKVYQWIEPGVDENAVFEKLRDKLMRWPLDRSSASGHTWVDALPPAIVARYEVQGSIWGNRTEMVALAMKRLPAVIERIESMIETYRRFESYQFEIHGMRQLNMSFQKWTQLSPSKANALEVNGLSYIIPAKPIAFPSFEELIYD